ncbi:hypothetical protein D3C75_158590 [compost metagenome]
MPKLILTTRKYSYKDDTEKNKHVRQMKRDGFTVLEDDGLHLTFIKQGGDK